MRWRNLWILVFLLISHSYLVLANSLLPEGWEVWLWGPGNYVEVRKDEEFKVEGNSSAQMRNMVGTVSLVQTLDINPARSNIIRFKGWARTVLEEGQLVHLAVAFYDKNESFLSEARSTSLTGDNNWTMLEVSVTSIPAAASKAIFYCRIVGPNVKSDGEVWFDDLSIEIVPSSRLTLANGGFEEWYREPKVVKFVPNNLFRNYFALSTELEYTPELGWNNERLVDFWTVLSNNPNMRIRLKGIYQRSNFYSNPDLRMDLGALEFAIRNNSYVYKNSRLNLTFGNLSLNYSPYILTLTNDQRSNWQRVPGISLENVPVEIGSGTFDAYVIPELSSQYGWGGRYRGKFGNASFTGVWYRKNRQSELLESNFAYNVAYRFSDGSVFSADWAQQNEIAYNRKSEAKFFCYDRSIENVNLTLRYYDFDLTFNPAYRNHQPQYDERRREITDWNPVDRYKGKIGYGFMLKGRKDLLGGTIEGDLWHEQSGQKYRFSTNLNANISGMIANFEALKKGEILTNIYGIRLYLQEYFRWGYGLVGEIAPTALRYGFYHETEHYLDSSIRMMDYFLQYRIPSGLAQGLLLTAGYQTGSYYTEPFSRLYLHGRWNLPNSTRLEWRYYTKDFHQPSSHYDPVRERRVEYDNIFLLTLRASFQ